VTPKPVVPRENAERDADEAIEPLSVGIAFF
jgi:hypothetical protein